MPFFYYVCEFLAVRWACIVQTDVLSGVRSLAALGSCNCICFGARRGKSKRKELTLLFQVIGSQWNRLEPCPELFMLTLPTQGLVLSCSVSGTISIPIPEITCLDLLQHRSFPSFHTFKYPGIALQNLHPGGKWWKYRFFSSLSEWNSLTLMICHVFLSTESPADARLDRNLSYRIPQKSLNSMLGFRKQKVH